MSKRRRKHPLAHKHAKQFFERTPSLYSSMSKYWALSFRPGGNQTAFKDAFVSRPLGSSAHIVMSADDIPRGSNNSRVIYLCGFNTSIAPDSAEVYVGGEQNSLFCKNLNLAPCSGGIGRYLDPNHNPSLTALGLEMDKHIATAATKSFYLPAKPLLPTIYHSFGQVSPPPTDTPELRQRIVSRQLMDAHGDIVTLGKLADMPSDSLAKLVATEWADLVIAPNDSNNATGEYLVDAQFYPRVRAAMRTYEYFDERLLGAEIFNPVRSLQDPQQMLSNPARKAAKVHNIKLGRNPNTDDLSECYTDEEHMKLQKTMRSMLGAWGPLVSDDDICIAIDNPLQAIIPEGVASPVSSIGEDATVELMRKVMPRYADCVRDEDFVKAAHNPNELMYAAHLAKIQVMRRTSSRRNDLTVSSKKLGVVRTKVDYHTIPDYWTVG